MSHETDIVRDYWSHFDCSASEENFYLFPPIRARSCELIFGEVDAARRDWCEYWTIEKLLKDRIPFEKCLSVCCGFGEIERILARQNVARQFVGTDIAPGAIEQAKQQAANEGLANIEYYVADLNQDDLPAGEFDLIWANGALHHISNLDVVIPKLHVALKDGGMLISNEYVGPNHQQLSGRQQELINVVKHILPPELRSEKVYYGTGGGSILAALLRGLKKLLGKFSKRHDRRFGQIWKMPSLDYMLKTDPSEGVNASQIIQTLEQHFEQVDVRRYHGSLLRYALDHHFYKNFDINQPRHRAILDALFKLEDQLIAAGEIPNDNAHLICRKDAATNVAAA